MTGFLHCCSPTTADVWRRFPEPVPFPNADGSLTVEKMEPARANLIRKNDAEVLVQRGLQLARIYFRAFATSDAVTAGAALPQALRIYVTTSATSWSDILFA